MEPVGTVASAISVAQLAWNSCRKLSDTIRGIQNAPEMLRSLEGDLTTLVQILELLISNLKSYQTVDIPTNQQHLLDGVKGALYGCHNVCMKFTAKVSELTSHSDAVKMSIRDRIRFHFKDTDIKLLKESLVQYKLTFNIALSVEFLQAHRAFEDMETQVATSLSSLTGKISSLEFAMQALSASQSSRADRADRDNLNEDVPGVVVALEEYKEVLIECLGVQRPALEETSSLNGTTVKWATVLDEAKQQVGNIGDVGRGGPAVNVTYAKASHKSRQYIGNISGELALELLR
ncbi:hypothetical protein SLS53_008671 [Cytospora paraplurivora]|uniref:Azaphilone pigments biosynthesis cluster protein L N-terminal domain-containing protein n=1 Tax=Cytospora paraplurivora TaxID=2898453 RepID=A0AAN9TZR8_9PEZI